MKIKIVSRWSNLPMTNIDELVYDIYYGFTGLPSTFPFCTKWKIDRAGLTKEEILKWFKNVALGYQDVILKL
jgi:hypothetical protein